MLHIRNRHCSVTHFEKRGKMSLRQIRTLERRAGCESIPGEGLLVRVTFARSVCSSLRFMQVNEVDHGGIFQCPLHTHSAQH